MNTCSALGINVHASFAVFKDPKAIEVAGGAEKAGAKTAVFGIFDEHRSNVFADPENQDVVNYEITLLREIVGLYNVDGINLDFIRYSGDTPQKGKILFFEIDRTWEVNAGAIEAFVRRVREEFPSVTLTADIFAGNGARIRLGQNGIIPYLEYSILMQYSDTDPDEINTKDEVKKYTDEFKANHPGREFLSLLRGWRCKKAWCNIDENRTDKRDEFKVNLKADIESAKRSGAKGYGVFTYENLLADVAEKALKDLKDDIGY